MHYSSREKCLRLVADRSLDKSYSSRSEALFNSNGDAGLILDESPRLVLIAMARPAHAHITEVRAPHLSMISNPGVVAQVITEAARAAG